MFLPFDFTELPRLNKTQRGRPDTFLFTTLAPKIRVNTGFQGIGEINTTQIIPADRLESDSAMLIATIEVCYISPVSVKLVSAPNAISQALGLINCNNAPCQKGIYAVDVISVAEDE